MIAASQKYLQAIIELLSDANGKLEEYLCTMDERDYDSIPLDDEPVHTLISCLLSLDTQIESRLRARAVLEFSNRLRAAVTESEARELKEAESSPDRDLP